MNRKAVLQTYCRGLNNGSLLHISGARAENSAELASQM
jgi:hypothetical protein